MTGSESRTTCKPLFQSLEILTLPSQCMLLTLPSQYILLTLPSQYILLTLPSQYILLTLPSRYILLTLPSRYILLTLPSQYILFLIKFLPHDLEIYTFNFTFHGFNTINKRQLHKVTANLTVP